MKFGRPSKTRVIPLYLTILIFTLFVSCDEDGDSNGILDFTGATTTQVIDEEENPQNRSILRISFNGEVRAWMLRV